jgi:CRP-like cAMP-binding protein
MARKSVSPRPQPSRPKNKLLRALPEADFQRIVPDLERIQIPARYIFYQHGKPISHVYFPNGGVASVTVVLSDGTMVETATVGVEGLVGIEAFFVRAPTAPGDTMMQVPDTDAERLSVAAFRREVARQGALAELMGRYAQASIAQMMQSTACNALHQIQERCCRWLLTTHDRIGRDDFRLSHEFLGVMLGVRRQSVTVVAGALQEAGLIRYKHGHMTIVNRKGLEDASCECYALIRRRFDALIDGHDSL